MSEPFIGEVKIVSFNYPPRGWAACDGALMQINQNQALFSLLGTQFGGNGQTTFALPDLRGRIAVHFDQQSYLMGQKGGETTHTLVGQEMPQPHNHVSQGTSNAGTTNLPGGQVFANPGLNAYAAPNPAQPVVQNSITPVVGGQAHENMSPYQALMFCIALQGVFPSRN